jgi:hypothetical protein
VNQPIRKLAALSWRSVARIGAKAVPAGIRKRMEDRFFFAVFHLTRVTNDHYPQVKKEE